MPVIVYRNVKIRNIQTQSRLTRIVIPQNPFKELSIRQRANVNKDELKRNAAWWILHRKTLVRKMKNVGVADPRELRAIPKTLVKGTLPERIVYLALLNMHFVPGLDFSFQSSQDGGRLQLGGIVADFLFEAMKLVIQVQGSTHSQFLRIQKDAEQQQILEAMGFTVIFLWEDVIYDIGRFEDEMRSIFNMHPVFGAGSMGNYIWSGPEDEASYKLVQIQDSAQQLVDMLRQL